jgi:cation diffusion facilitator family transporter
MDNDRKALQFAMALSLAIGVLMLVMKVSAYLLTGSSAILGDAAESVVHVLAVLFAAYSLRLSFKPPDSDHLYGHSKVSFFSAGFEGALIIGAAIFIIYDAVTKWMAGLELQNLGTGTILTLAAAVINGALGAYLVWIGKQRKSIILAANGRHVLTDCWTSIGVLVGLSLTLLTGRLFWDPLCAIFVAINILVSGFGLMRQSVGGLMDTADPLVQERLESLLTEHTARHGIDFHDLRHRDVGNGHRVEVHLLFPDEMSVRDAHRIATEIEHIIEESLEPRAYVLTHLEAVDDHELVHPPKPTSTSR